MIKKVIKSIILIVFILLLPSMNVIAGGDNYIFKNIRVEDGLSQSTVFTILQDQKGYLWFGTANGLNKYDGYSFKIYTYDPADTNSISDNGITSMFEDKNGYIWIGTIGGYLNKFDRKTGRFTRYRIKDFTDKEIVQDESFYEFPLPFSRNNELTVTSIAKDTLGNIWIGTWGHGLIKFNEEKNETVNYVHNENDSLSISSNRVNSLVVDSDGTLWIGTLGGGLNKAIIKNDYIQADRGLEYVENVSFVRYYQEDKNISEGNKRINTLLEDSNHNIWIGNFNSGLSLLTADQKNLPPDEVSFKFFRESSNNPNGINSNTITAIVEDAEGFIWIGTFGGGLNKLDVKKEKFTHYIHEPENSNSLAKNDILSLLIDKTGILWIGTHLGKGLNRLERNTVKFNKITRAASNSPGLNDDVVWSIYKDKEGIIWIGTYKGGLNRYDPEKNQYDYIKFHLDQTKGLDCNHIREIAEDNYGNLWLGTYSGGLLWLNKKTRNFVQFINDPGDSTSLGSNQVQSIYIDSSSTFWIGTFGGGLNTFKWDSPNPPPNINFTRYLNNPDNPQSISDNRVYTVDEDTEGIIWAGTFGGGLNKFDKENQSFISFQNIPGDDYSLSENRILTFTQDSKEFYWIGTYGGGLNKYDEYKDLFFRYNEKNRLNSGVVYGILEDGDYNLWMSTDNGLFKFDPKSENFTQYDLHDGLQSMEFSGSATYKADDGELFFGGINGLNHFYPDSVKDNAFVPPIVISNFKIFNEPVLGEKDKIELSYTQNFFSVEFAALDYTNPGDNKYGYKLEGLNDNWQYTTAASRRVTYTNLPPGEYTLRVIGSNNDGVWNREGVSLQLIILPPFWQTWWFITFSILLLGGIVYYLSTVRIRNLLSIEKLKTKIAADLHDNIGSGLTEISILSELASNDVKTASKGSEKRLRNISDLSRQLVDNMSDIVWVVNPKRDSLYDLILRLKDSYSDIFTSLGISFRTNNLEKLSEVKLPMDYRQNLFMIFKEGISNAVKHSKCNKISLDVNVNKEIIELVLKDDGVGIDLDESKAGNGLKNMELRAKSIKGKLEWNSNPGKGTTIHFKGKVKNNPPLLSYFKK